MNKQKHLVFLSDLYIYKGVIQVGAYCLFLLGALSGMLFMKLLLVLGLVASQCWAQNIDSSEHGVTAGKRGTSCKCGYANKDQMRIVGGVETKVNEYPHMAALAWVSQGSVENFCGCAILTPRHALTAAHCTIGEDYRYLAIVVGEHDFNRGQETNSTKVYPLAKIIQHEKYDDVLTQYDISLLVTKTKITFNQAVHPICMPTSQLNIENKNVKVTGWGHLKWKGPSSSVLMKVNLNVVNLKTCATYYPDGGIDLINKHQFCTYAPKKDSCQGDSGGPVIWLDPETNRYTLAGVVSFGNECAGPSPGVNTDVSVFIDWIQRHIQSDKSMSVKTCSKV